MKLQARDVVIHHRRQRYGDMLLAVDGATMDIGAETINLGQTLSLRLESANMKARSLNFSLTESA